MDVRLRASCAPNLKMAYLADNQIS